MNNTNIIADNLRQVSETMYPLRDKIKVDRKHVDKLLHIFKGVKDFRQAHKTKYNLENILCICLILAMKGLFTSFSYAAKYIVIHADYFRKLNLIEGNDYPSHDTLSRIFQHIDAKELRDVLLKRIERLIKKITSLVSSSEKQKIRLLSGDGKTFNGSGRKDGKRNINVFNIFDSSSSLCLISEPLDDKESEIPAFQTLLKRYKLTNTMVTADALHCQRETCKIITDKCGLYTFKVKDNHAALKEHMTFVMDKNRDKCIKKNFNNCDYEIFILDYKATELEFPGTKAFVRMVSHKRKDQKDYNPEQQYFISSANNDQLIMEAIDNRWHIESGLHWFKDTELHEDECTFMNKNSIEVMATLNNIVYAIYRLAAAIFYKGDMGATRMRYTEQPDKLLAKLVPLMEKQNLTNLLKENMRSIKSA